MEKVSIAVKALSAWRPEDAAGLPDLPFVPAMQRRRMTALSKLTTALIHGVKDKLSPDAKIYFVSLAGEAARQLQVNTMVLQDNEMLPATFSTSVFNTPPAMASIALGLRNGYAALYPEPGDFSSAVQAVIASLVAGNSSQVLMVYGDVQSPKEYQGLEGACARTWGYAALLEPAAGGGGNSFPALDFAPEQAATPQDFFQKLLDSTVPLVSLQDGTE